MPKILLVADATWVRDAVHAALSTADYEISEHDVPATIVEAVVRDEPDAAVVDLQVASMGGMAITRAIRDATAIGDLPDVPVVIMLDRRADAFLAKRAGAAAWLTKPFDAAELRSAITAALTPE